MLKKNFSYFQIRKKYSEFLKNNPKIAKISSLDNHPWRTISFLFHINIENSKENVRKMKKAKNNAVGRWTFEMSSYIFLFSSPTRVSV